jgi:addiction module RelB/DinJ family antitoxin
MATATKSLQVTISSEDRALADSILSELGLDTPTAVRLFLKQVILTRSIPFPIGLAATVETVELSPTLQAKADQVGAAMDAFVARRKKASA